MSIEIVSIVNKDFPGIYLVSWVHGSCCCVLGLHVINEHISTADILQYRGVNTKECHAYKGIWFVQPAMHNQISVEWKKF